jgi:chromosome segregation ATPase
MIDGGDAAAETAEQINQTLRQQVRELETGLVAAHTALRECREQKEMFETAAGERLAAILHGETLLTARMEAITALRAELERVQREFGECQERLAAALAENAAVEARARHAARESARGMAELAERERRLTQENLELRNQGLLHSICCLSSLFS